MRANFITYDNCSNFFEKKFKRKLKTWSINDVHDLWVRACKRSDIRQNEKSNFIRQIVEEIPMNDRKEHVIYFNHNKNIHCYKISWNSDWKSYGISQGRVELKTRDEKLTFILAKDKEFEMGHRYYHLDYMTTQLQWRIKEILWRMVEEKLREKFKNTTKIPDIFILDIGSKKYFIELDNQHRYGYCKFHMKNEYNGDYLSL
jgi:hypothetical protein